MIRLLFLLCIPVFVVAQKTKFTVLPAGYIVKNNTEHEGDYVISKDSKSSAILAMEPGYATEFFSADSIIDSKKTAYTFYLKPVIPLERKKISNKLVMGEIYDKTYKIRFTDRIAGGYLLEEYSSSEFKTTVVEKLSQNNFLMSNGSGSDYAISGEIIHYIADRKGTLGYRTTIAVKWNLRDVDENVIVYSAITGGYSNMKQMMTEKTAFRLALEDAVSGIITDETIQAYMYGSGNLVRTESWSGPEIRIPEITNSLTRDNFIEKAIESSVTIKTKRGHGSGFVISTDGYILTNFHVIKDSLDMQAIFQNELTLPLRIVSYDKATDVALCKVPGKGYKPLPIDTNAIVKKVGSDVIAIGTPEDMVLGQTVTKGIVSGIRKIQNNIYIQTDVTLNSGNSGGLLMNGYGEIIGVVCAKLKGDGIEGLGFAIPIGQALRALHVRMVSKE